MSANRDTALIYVPAIGSVLTLREYDQRFGDARLPLAVSLGGDVSASEALVEGPSPAPPVFFPMRATRSASPAREPAPPDRANAAGYTFVVDGVEIEVPLIELAMVAAFRRSPRPPMINVCLACFTTCIEPDKLSGRDGRPCGCCRSVPADVLFNQGHHGSENPHAHRMIPAAQLAEALAKVSAA